MNNVIKKKYGLEAGLHKALNRNIVDLVLSLNPNHIVVEDPETGLEELISCAEDHCESRSKRIHQSLQSVK